jgi:hypothetical protein
MSPAIMERFFESDAPSIEDATDKDRLFLTVSSWNACNMHRVVFA